MSGIYIAWDGNQYDGTPPDGWYLGSDDRRWSPGTGPGPKSAVPSPAPAAPQPAPTMAAPPPAAPMPQQFAGAVAHACPRCGIGMMPAQRELTQKKRVKFGLFWVIISLFSFGLAVLVWLILPRKNVVIGVDRFYRCSVDGTEAAG